MNDRARSAAFRTIGNGPVVLAACVLSAIAALPGVAVAEGNADDEAALRAGVEPADLAELVVSAPVTAGVPLRGIAVVPASLIARAGQTPAGLAGPITVVNNPFTNGLGAVGFSGVANDGAAGTDNYIWSGSGVQFVDSSVVGTTLSGAEGTMGIGDAGQFIYSPSANGNDAVWTQNGLLLAGTNPAPGFPAGVTVTFNSRPQMRPNGQAYWVAGFNDSGGTATQGRVLFTASPTGTISVVLRSDDIVNAIPIARPSGIGFDYAVSDNGVHLIQTLLLATGSSTNDDFVYVDGTGIAREGAPNGTGDNWAAFDNVTINDQGAYMFSGDSSGATTTDEFITYGDLIVLREGAVVDGQPLTTAASVQALSLNNSGNAAHLWSISGGTELLFFSCSAADLATQSRLLLATGDLLDLDGNGTGDAAVTDFNASSAVGPGLSLGENGSIYIDIDIDPVAGPFDAVIRLTAPGCDFVFGDGFEGPS